MGRCAALLLPLVLAAGCDFNILSGGFVPPADPPPPPALTSDEIAGTACLYGEMPRPACLRHRSYILHALCGAGRAAQEACAANRRDLPLPPRRYRRAI